MNHIRTFLAVTFVAVCAVCSGQVNASPHLQLWLSGSFNPEDSTIDVQVHRANSDFGLGGLAYNLQFSESLWLTREYSTYGWVANDGLFDNSMPADVGAAGSSPGSFSSISFETVRSPAGQEFAAGEGVVESLHITVSDTVSARWIYFDIVSPFASDGSGSDLVSGLSGSIDAGQGHSLSILVPEPISMTLLGLGGLLIMRKRNR